MSKNKATRPKYEPVPGGRSLSLVLRSLDQDGAVNIQTWPLILTAEEITELLAIPNVFDEPRACQRAGTRIYPIEMALLLETVLQSKIRRRPFLAPVLDKLRQNRWRRGNWQLHVIDRADEGYIDDLVTGNLPPFDFEALELFRHRAVDGPGLLPLTVEEIGQTLTDPPKENL